METGLIHLLALVCVLGLALVSWRLRGALNRCMAEARTTHRRADLLTRVSRELSSSLDLSTTQSTVTACASEAVGDLSALYLFPESEERPSAPELVSAAFRDSRGTRDCTSEIRGLEGARDAVVEAAAGGAYLLPEFRERLPMDGGGVLPLQGALVVPLFASGRILGVLLCASPAGRPGPTTAKLQLALLLADRAALAVEHGRLYARLQRVVEAQTEELRKTQAKLLATERERAISDLAAMVAHEIRNPLNVVRTSTYLLEEKLKGTDPRLDRHLGRIGDQVEAAAHVIRDLVDYGALPPPQRERTDLGELVKQVVTGVRASAGDALRWRLPDEALPVDCDAQQVRRALRNLLLNALQAVDGAGEVVVTVQTHHGRGLVEVCQSTPLPPGITSEQLFDPLFAGRTRGLGLGLALTRRIIEENGGDIDAEQLDQSTIYRARLPLAAEVERLPGWQEGGSRRAA